MLEWGGASVTPIDTRTDTAAAPIQVGGYPVAIGLTSDGRTAVVLDTYAGRATLVNTLTVWLRFCPPQSRPPAVHCKTCSRYCCQRGPFG